MCYNFHGSSGSQCPRQELTGCSVLTQGQESRPALHPAVELCQHSAPVLSGGKFQLPRADKCRLLHTHGVHNKKPSNLRFASDPPQIIQKKKNHCLLKIKACVLLPTMQAFFFSKSQEHCSCYFGSRESIPTVRRHRAQFISRINTVSYAGDDLSHIALS